MSEGAKGVFRRGAAAWVLLAGLLGGILTLTGQIKDAWNLAGQALTFATRPFHHYRLTGDGAPAREAARLLRENLPDEACVQQAMAADLSESAWKADLVILFSPKLEGEPCGPMQGEHYLAAFVPNGLSMRHAGTGGGPGSEQSSGLPSTAAGAGRFFAQTFYGVDNPYTVFWYVHDGGLRHVDGVTIPLTDHAENEYKLSTKVVPGGLIGWGTPSGLFHLLVDKDGKVTTGPGLPRSMAKGDSLALDLHWDGSTFRTAPRVVGGASAASSERADWPEYAEVAKEGDTVTVLRLTPLVRLYLSGCEAVTGFAPGGEDFPGALLPRFNEAPLLRCGGTGEEGAAFEIRVARREP